MPKKLERLILWNFLTSILLQNIKKIEGALRWKKNFRKVSTVPKKLEGRTLSVFSTSIAAKHQKIEGGPPLGIFFRKKSHNAKKLGGRPFGIFRSRKNFRLFMQLCRFSPDLSMKISIFSKTVHTIFMKICSHSTPKRAQNCMTGM